MNILKLVISGVGGQGTLLASRLIAQSAIETGLPVKIGETYGMAQRGGPVMSHIQIGGDVKTPRIRPGDADVILGFEEGEAVRRAVTFLKKDGLAIVNSRRFPPVEVISGLVFYPGRDELMSLLKEVTKDVVSFDATDLAEKAGDPITTNVVMLGALTASGYLPFQEEIVMQVIRKNMRKEFLETNLQAFLNGKKAYIEAYSKN